MDVPSKFPLIKPAFLSSFKCWETVGCAKGNSLTISPQILLSTLIKYSIMAIRAGCPNALVKIANSFCWSVNCSVLDAPIVIFLYCNITININAKQNYFIKGNKLFKINIDVIQSSNDESKSGYDTHYFFNFGYGFEIFAQFFDTESNNESKNQYG
jgi:hypothetical protein